MRWLLVGAVLVGTAGCSLFQTPCGRVADSICAVPGEAASCTFLKGLRSENGLAQKTCRSLEPSAKAYAADPASLLEKARWLAARVALGAVGFVGDQVARTPEDKLRKAGAEVGDAARNAGEALGDAAKNAGDAIKDAVKDATK